VEPRPRTDNAVSSSVVAAAVGSESDGIHGLHWNLRALRGRAWQLVAGSWKLEGYDGSARAAGVAVSNCPSQKDRLHPPDSQDAYMNETAGLDTETVKRVQL
jgi:hypothetical protein